MSFRDVLGTAPVQLNRPWRSTNILLPWSVRYSVVVPTILVFIVSPQILVKIKACRGYVNIAYQAVGVVSIDLSSYFIFLCNEALLDLGSRLTYPLVSVKHSVHLNLSYFPRFV